MINGKVKFILSFGKELRSLTCDMLSLSMMKYKNYMSLLRKVVVNQWIVTE